MRWDEPSTESMRRVMLISSDHPAVSARLHAPASTSSVISYYGSFQSRFRAYSTLDLEYDLSTTV